MKSKLSGIVKINFFLFIILNVLIAYCSIWFFMRLVPTTEKYSADNEASLQAVTNMLSTLILNKDASMPERIALRNFERDLKVAENSITEKFEDEQIAVIKENYRLAMQGEKRALRLTVLSLRKLADLNRQAIHNSSFSAKHMSTAGAWGIVFLASIDFIICLFMMRSFERNLVSPIEEMSQTLSDYRKGNLLRRCAIYNQPNEIISLLKDLNELLDANSRYKKDQF